MALKAGDWVEVRSKPEILQTLDSDARLDNMPFMPEMFKFCGHKFQVQARAHKTCDPIYTISSRTVANAVHLNTRCDGSAHGGCQTACLLFWKEAWLKPSAAPADGVASDMAPQTATARDSQGSCTEQTVHAATRVGPAGAEDGPDTQYVCQTTNLNQFSERLSCWDMRQYWEDYTSGNVTLLQILRGTFYVLLGRNFEKRFTPIRRFYDRVELMFGGMRSPSLHGTLPPGTPCPVKPLNLRAGEFVRVKSHEEILATMREDNLHRGMYFDVEMVPFCGGVYRVKTPVERFVDEKTGRMRSLKTPAVILEEVWCNSRFSKCRMYCPRKLHSWWREEWLERVDETTAAKLEEAAAAKIPDREKALA